MVMTTKGAVSFLTRDGIKAVVNFLQMVGIPALTIIGSIAIGKFNTIIAMQEKFATIQQEHASRLTANSTAIVELKTADIKLQRYDMLFGVKQEAMRDALQVNPTIGKIFVLDYDTKYQDKLNDSNFMNP